MRHIQLDLTCDTQLLLTLQGLVDALYDGDHLDSAGSNPVEEAQLALVSNGGDPIIAPETRPSAEWMGDARLLRALRNLTAHVLDLELLGEEACLEQALELLAGHDITFELPEAPLPAVMAA